MFFCTFITGDSPPHALWDETLEKQRDTTKWVAESIGRRIPNVTVYPAYGNHGMQIFYNIGEV